MTDFNQKTHDTDVGSHGGQSRQMMEVFENQEFGSIRVLQEAGKKRLICTTLPIPEATAHLTTLIIRRLGMTWLRWMIWLCWMAESAFCSYAFQTVQVR